MNRIVQSSTKVLAAVVPVALVLGSTGVALANPGKGHKARTAPSVLTAQPAALTSSRTATFAWADPGASGYSYTFTCSRDGLAAVPCTSPTSYSGLTDRQHSFALKTTARLTSNGATSKPVGTSWTWKVDTVAPAVPTVNPIASPTSNTSATVSFSDADLSATFTCALDGAAATACTSPMTYTGLADGLHTVVVTAADTAGNHTSKTITWTVDHSAPNIPNVVGPTSPTNATSASVAFTGAAGDTFRCRLDSGTEAVCTSPWTSGATPLADGAHVLVVTPLDGVGNRGAAGTAVWIVDTAAPGAPRLVSGPASSTSLLDISVQFADLDLSVVRHTCEVDGGTPQACDSGFTVSNPNDGAHSVVIRSFDLAGNASLPLTVSWTEDTLSLPVEFASGPATPTADTHPAFDFSPTDPTTVDFQCSLDGGAYASCVPGVAYDVATDGPHVLNVVAVDGASPPNVSPATPWGWTLDTSAPVTAPQAGGSTSTGTASTAPVLTFTSNDPTVAGFVCSVDGGAFTACASGDQPAVGEGPHTVVVTPVDQAGNQGTGTITYTFTVDTVAPTSAPTVTTGTTPAASGPVSGAPTLSFGTPDPDVVGFVCAVDGGTAVACATGFVPAASTEGPHTVVVSAVDAAGNVSSSGLTYTFTIDTTPPTSGPVDGGTVVPTQAVVTAPALTFSSTDADVTGFVCSVDGAAFIACSSGFVPTVADGSHTVVVAAVDAAGNQAAQTLSYTFTTDATGPANAPQPSGAAVLGAVTAAPVLTFSSPDADAAGFLCSIDGAAPVSCSTGLTAPGTEGDHSVVVRSVDALGNASAQALTYTYTVDTVAPASGPVDTTAPLPTGPVSGPPALTFTSNEAGVSGFACSVDGGPFTPCTSPFRPIVADGTHTVVVAAVDGAGNRSAQTLSYTFTTDTVGPTGAPVPSGTPLSSGTVATVPVLTFTTSNPDATGFACSVDGGAFVACTSGFQPPVGDGTHTVTVVTTDSAENHSSETVDYSFTLDTTRPTATTRTPATLVAPVLLTFSEDVQGITTATTLLRVVGSTVTPTRLSCQSAAGAAVSCAGFVRRAVLTPVKPLVPGVRYQPSASTLVHDLAGNRAAVTGAAFRGQLLQQESSPAVNQVWHAVPTKAALGGRWVAADRTGASATYAFTGTAITWYTTTGPSMGTAKVYVDGVYKGTVNNYSATTRTKVARSVTRLVKKAHTLKIVATGVRGSSQGKGTNVVIDAVKVGTTTVLNPALKTTWGVGAATRASGGRFVVADQAGDAVTMTFRGTRLTWTTVTGRGMGKARVYVDGVLKATVDNYAPSTGYGVRRVLALTNRVHTVKIVVLGTHRAGATGSGVVLDALTVG